MPENNDRIPFLRRREALASAGALGLGLVWTNGCGWFDSAGAAVEEDAEVYRTRHYRSHGRPTRATPRT